MARKAGQIIARGPRTWLVRISIGRDKQSNTRKYDNKTIHGSMRDAQ
jgi:integrase